jgi:hypothetical protein
MVKTNAERQRKYTAKNRSKINAKARQFYPRIAEKKHRQNKEWRNRDLQGYRKANRISHRKGLSGFTEEMFQTRLESQGNCCAICKGEMKRPCGDHDHQTGVQRGILCTTCNSGLGFFKDDPSLLRSAENYLRFWKGTR